MGIGHVMKDAYEDVLPHVDSFVSKLCNVRSATVLNVFTVQEMSRIKKTGAKLQEK